MSIEKVIVAVHGIGDQNRNATVRSVANRIGSTDNVRIQLPLGFFAGKDQTKAQVRQLRWPAWQSSPVEDLGFAEIYWADIPRKAVKDEHTLEETKLWAESVVARLRAEHGPARGFNEEDFDQAAFVLGDMIEVIATLENLCFLASKAGLFKFDLAGVLRDYLGDVQLVTEYESYRNDIIKRFKEQMEDIHSQAEGKPIYVVAHSEGTVVAFLGLLDALQSDVAWAKCVRGFMTIGSPIDKHLALWPHIFERYYTIGKTAPSKGERIVWCNYYDYADPVGFRLDTVRDEIEHRDWKDYFDFSVRCDFGFSRYVYPGEAHNEYWTDPVVFGDFFEYVVKKSKARKELADAEAEALEKKEVPSLPRCGFISCAIPYAISICLLLVAVLVLYSRVQNTVTLPPESVLEMMRNVSVLTGLLAGLTLAVRVPRLAKYWLPKAEAWAVFVVSLGLYAIGMTENAQVFIGCVFGSKELATLGVIGLVMLAAVWATLISKEKRRALIASGAGVVLVLLIGMLRDVKSITVLWPVVLSGAAFLYLWLLAMLIFDLTFIWHRYIRHANIQTWLRDWRRELRETRSGDADKSGADTAEATKVEKSVSEGGDSS